MARYGDSTAGISTADAFAVLDDEDLNLLVIDELWGEDSVDWLITQRVLDESSPGDIAERRRIAGVEIAPVIELSLRTTAAPRRREGELRAA